MASRAVELVRAHAVVASAGAAVTILVGGLVAAWALQGGETEVAELAPHSTPSVEARVAPPVEPVAKEEEHAVVAPATAI